MKHRLSLACGCKLVFWEFSSERSQSDCLLHQTSCVNLWRNCSLEKWSDIYQPVCLHFNGCFILEKVIKMNRGRPSHTALDPTVWNQNLFISRYWLNWRSTCRPTGTPTNVSHPLHSSPLMCTCLSFISFHLSLFIELNHRHECVWLWCDAQPSINPYLPHCSSPS